MKLASFFGTCKGDITVEFFAQEAFIFVYMGLMIILFFNLLMGFALKVTWERSFVREAVRKLKEIRTETPDVSDRILEWDRYLKRRYSPFERKFLLGRKYTAWKAFKEAFEDQSKVKNSVPPDIYVYFSEDQLLPKHSLRDIIPGLYLSFGILGTFIGIMAGLSNLNTEILEVKQLQKSVGSLIGGMKIKFGSSGAGVIASIIWQVVDKLHFQKHLIAGFEELRVELDKTFPLPLEVDLIEERMNVYMKHFVQGVGQAVAAALAPQLERTNRIMESLIHKNGVMPTAQPVSQPAHSDAHQKLGDSLSALTQTSKGIGEVAGTFSASFKTTDNQAERYREVVTQIQEVLAHASTAKSNEHLNHSVGQFANDLNTALSRAFELVDQELSKATSQLGQGVVNVSEQSDVGTEQLEKLKDSVRELSKLVNPPQNRE